MTTAWSYLLPPKAEPTIHLSAVEADELYRFLAHSYINPNEYPQLTLLVRRLGRDA